MNTDKEESNAKVQEPGPVGLVGSTLIFTDKGEFSIEKIFAMPADLRPVVWTLDHKKMTFELQKITSIDRLPVESVVRLKIGRFTIACTPSLRVFTRQSYVAAGLLGAPDQVSSFECYEEYGGNSTFRASPQVDPLDPAEVFNLQVQENHNVYAGGVLVSTR